MSMNPFDDPNGVFLVLVNGEGQHSLWPAALAVPEGWSVAKEESSKPECVEYIEAHWTDLRPRSVVAATAG